MMVSSPRWSKRGKAEAKIKRSMMLYQEERNRKSKTKARRRTSTKKRPRAIKVAMRQPSWNGVKVAPWRVGRAMAQRVEITMVPMNIHLLTCIEEERGERLRVDTLFFLIYIIE